MYYVLLSADGILDILGNKFKGADVAKMGISENLTRLIKGTLTPQQRMRMIREIVITRLQQCNTGSYSVG